MSDREAKLQEQQARGEALERAAKVFNELVFEELRKRCLDTFERSDIHDAVGQRTCRMYLQVLNDIRDRIEVVVRTGENARKELVRLKDPNRLRQLINVR